jgi:hypothetical protein
VAAVRTVEAVRVTFRKVESGQCDWEAVRARRTRVPGCCMGGRIREGQLPHDLAGFVIEGGLGLRNGFWGLVAEGATFNSMRKRPTRGGRALIAAHRAELDAAEARVHAEEHLLEQGGASPLRPEWEAMVARWAALPVGEALELEWPLPTGPLRSGGRRARTRRGPARQIQRGIGTS